MNLRMGLYGILERKFFSWKLIGRSLESSLRNIDSILEKVFVVTSYTLDGGETLTKTNLCETMSARERLRVKEGRF